MAEKQEVIDAVVHVEFARTDDYGLLRWNLRIYKMYSIPESPEFWPVVTLAVHADVVSRAAAIAVSSAMTFCKSPIRMNDRELAEDYLRRVEKGKDMRYPKFK